MIRHRCPHCRAEIYFDNLSCLSCGAALVFAPGEGMRAAPEAATCKNRARIGCNWQALEGADGLCLSCAHTEVIPDLSIKGNTERWAKFEAAKRMLMRMLRHLDLPLTDGAGARFPRFHFKGPDATGKVVMGHQNGLITLNIAEADDEYRISEREQMRESYRTLIGHLRHESAHAYWEALIQPNAQRLAEFRNLFGDERADYGDALKRHYKLGPPDGWERGFVSAYSTAHPWEDFAESWAHLCHMVDTMETALSWQLAPLGRLAPYAQGGFDLMHELLQAPFQDVVEEWISLSVALNALNSAMGHPSFYPFILGPKVSEKLDWIRTVIRDHQSARLGMS
ncbi:hypothetical protein BFP70_11070 [Thioclava sp. SK-1]|uniref:zinc-binding metallopeptidase family protein n=1 Tax=Thioclava sp. SK-1 TaxID=1889770 RepID=UPI000824EE47|nr:putative zinc-binding metallopeptidase [Thioclava sp. SK-1]OCX64566.1 hypothetical protein BFP70_11070 [Thioclava sp. SK-1]